MNNTFCKYHGLNNDSLIKEVKNLNLIRQNLLSHSISEIKLPEIFSYDEDEIIMQKIHMQEASKEQMVNLGIGLASLHKIKQQHYGLNEDNFIGLASQKNIISQNWGEFFVDYRLLYQISLIEDFKIKEKFEVQIKKNRLKLISFLNANVQFPSIIHGDLWSGNVLFDEKDIYFIDPASYYADREVDIAMTHLFGGFTMDFYKSYNSIFPLSANFKQKQVIYNLYHYLNHYNLFGKSYLNSSLVSLSFIDNYLNNK